MILVDTGPFVALFDPQDGHHTRCREALKGIRETLRTTIPVLTEAFHMLGPASRGATNLRRFISQGGASVWFMDASALARSFQLMEQYADHPMDLADASLVAAAEVLETRKIFTLDRADFLTYRIRLGHRASPLDLVLP